MSLQRYDGEGAEVPKEDADHGNHTHKLPADAFWKVDIDGETLEAQKSGGDAELKVGDGAKHAAIVEALEMLWGQTEAAINGWQSHTHPDGFGSTGPAASPPNFPSWDSAINSSKLSFPDG